MIAAVTSPFIYILEFLDFICSWWLIFVEPYNIIWSINYFRLATELHIK